MMILSRVCAQFRDARGNVIFTVDPSNWLTFVEAPEAIQEDPLFQMLVEDGSLDASITPAKRKTLENDPTAGTDASGKKVGKPAAKKNTAKAEAPAEQTDPDTTEEKPK